jgi:GT2 family glycosyltransferase
MSKCVTVVVKTARRPLLVLRLAKSLEITLKQNLTMIVIDDGPDLHPPETMEKIAQYPNIKYIIGEKKDLGISEGRNMGVRMVETKYFLNFDDDFVVSDRSNITTMLEMLDIMDISLVGCKFEKIFAGFMDFLNSNETGEPVLMHYPGSCAVKSQELTSYPGCYRCELTANGFMARTQDILDVGGWSKELKINEHKDVFLRLKAAGKKVVYCESFRMQNVRSIKGESTPYNGELYRALRHRAKIMEKRFVNHWNIVEEIRNEDKKTWPKIWD